MRIDLPLCGLQTCRNYFDGNCKSKNDYEKCEYAYDKNRLAELEDKLEQGLMIELPCKVGDTVYKVNKASKKVSRHKIIEMDLNKATFGNYQSAFFSSFGKTVFLTESEAQAELERRNL